MLLIIIGILLFLSGVFEGFIESLKYQYAEVKRKLPFLSDKYWNPAISSKNKYKNGEKAQGSAFPFSTNALVWITDGYHLMNFLANNILFLALGLAGILNLPYNPILIVLVMMVLTHVFYSMGCSLCVDFLFKK
jgi:hypothetical protein